jgi:hypothetical protein
VALVKQLVERERELAAVEALLERGGGLLAVEGGAGIGKTSLLEAGCQLASKLGYQILSARGSELEADFAFGVVHQLFERRLTSADVNEREALLAGAATAVRPLLFGQLLGALATAEDTSFAVSHSLYWLAANLAAQRPLLLTVDDTHWTDEPSVRWLTYLARRLEGLPLTMLVTLRSGEAIPQSGSLLALRAEAQTLLRLELLSESAASAVEGLRGRTRLSQIQQISEHPLCRAVQKLSHLSR